MDTAGNSHVRDQGQPERVEKTLLDLLERLADAIDLADVNCAAGIALTELRALND